MREPQKAEVVKMKLLVLSDVYDWTGLTRLVDESKPNLIVLAGDLVSCGNAKFWYYYDDYRKHAHGIDYLEYQNTPTYSEHLETRRRKQARKQGSMGGWGLRFNPVVFLRVLGF